MKRMKRFKVSLIFKSQGRDLGFEGFFRVKRIIQEM